MASRERVFPATPAIFGGGRILASPSQFYLTGEDRLRIVSANALPGVVVSVQWRSVNSDGDTVPSSERHTPASDRTVTRQDFELGTGSLLNVTVFATSGAPVSGQTYVMVQLVRGFGSAAIVLGTLLAGYITATQALGFPGSPIQSAWDTVGVLRKLTGTRPAAGVDFLETCPTGAIWRLHAGIFALTTVAAGVNRVERFAVVNTGNTINLMPAANAAAPNTVTQFCYGVGLPLSDYLVIGNTFVRFQPFGAETWLDEGDSFEMESHNLNAADQWDAPLYLVREFLKVG